MKESINNKNNIVWIVNLRAIAVIAVILLHVSAQMIYSFGKISNINWWASNLYESPTRFCVPVFIAITGALTLGKTYRLSYFFQKRFLRILIPFVFWSFIYIFYYLSIYYLKTGEALNLAYILSFIWEKLAFGAAYHMWYIYMLIGIYLIHPVINKWIIYSSSKEQMYFLFLCLFAILINFYPFSFFKTAVSLNYFTEFLGYLVLGYFLYNKNVKANRKLLLILILCFILSCFIICSNTYITSIKENAYAQRFRPWDILQVLSVFLLFKSFSFFNKKNIILEVISKYSYGIYLIHVLIMDLLAKAGLAYYSFNPYLSIPVTTIFTLFFSLLILYLLNKLPLGKYVVK